MADEVVKEEKKPEMAKVNDKKEKYNSSKTGLMIVLTIITIAAVVFAAWATTDRADRHKLNDGVAITRSRMGGDIGRREFAGGVSAAATNQQQISGVATAVSDGSFTLAGGGVSNTVKTNSSTQYSGADKVSVNDSVVVIGTTSDNTFTATQVYVNP